MFCYLLFGIFVVQNKLFWVFSLFGVFCRLNILLVLPSERCVKMIETPTLSSHRITMVLVMKDSSRETTRLVVFFVFSNIKQQLCFSLMVNVLAISFGSFQYNTDLFFVVKHFET